MKFCIFHVSWTCEPQHLTLETPILTGKLGFPGDCRQICHLVLNSQRPPSLDARFGDFYLQVNSSPQLDSGLLLSLDIYILDGNIVWRSTTTAVEWCLLPSLLNRSSCNMIKVIVLWWPGTRVFRINICGFSKFASSRTKGLLWEITCFFFIIFNSLSFPLVFKCVIKNPQHSYS